MTFTFHGSKGMPQWANPAHLAGSTKRKNRRKQLSGTKGEAKGKYRYVSYCATCPVKDNTHPQYNVNVVVTGFKTGTIVTCKNGHKWAIR